jgi:hypothetical protein
MLETKWLLQLKIPYHKMYVKGDNLKVCLKYIDVPTTMFNKDRHMAKSSKKQKKTIFNSV